MSGYGVYLFLIKSLNEKAKQNMSHLNNITKTFSNFEASIRDSYVENKNTCILKIMSL